MRVVDIQRCEVRPGRLVEWTLHPAVVESAARLPEDTRSPAYVQESHIRTARSIREAGLFVPTWVGTAFDIPGAVDLDNLQEALRLWTLRHETMRSGFRWSSGEMRRFTLPVDSVELHREDVGDFPDPAKLVHRLQARFDVAADALAWPNFIYAAVVRSDGTSVYMAFDHSNVDAYSIYRIPAEIHDLYAAGAEGRTVDRMQVASYVDFGAAERENADQIDATHPVVERWRRFLTHSGGKPPRFPADLGLTAEGELPTQRLTQKMLLNDADATAFEQYCRPYGGTLVGILAATGLALRELTGLDVYRTVALLHTRARSELANSVGWYVGEVPLEIPVCRAPDLPSAMRLVRDELRNGRLMSRVPVARVLQLLGAGFQPSPDLYSIVSFADTRGVSGSKRWHDLKAYALLRVSRSDQVCVWFTRLHEGLQLACRHPDTDPANKNIRRCVELLRSMILRDTARGLATGRLAETSQVPASGRTT